MSANGAGAELRLDAGPVVRAAESRGASPRERCHAVVRPEKLELYPAGEATPAGRARVSGVVESSLYLGTATQVVVGLDGVDGVQMTVLVPNSDEDARRRLPAAGDPVALSWAGEHMHLVRDAEGGDEEVPVDVNEEES